jgi:hypothetical protein
MASMRRRVADIVEEHGFELFWASETMSNGYMVGDYNIGLPRGFTHVNEYDERTGLSGMFEGTRYQCWKLVLEDLKWLLEEKPNWVRDGECAKTCCVVDA